MCTTCSHDRRISPSIPVKLEAFFQWPGSAEIIPGEHGQQFQDDTIRPVLPAICSRCLPCLALPNTIGCTGTIAAIICSLLHLTHTGEVFKWPCGSGECQQVCQCGISCRLLFPIWVDDLMSSDDEQFIRVSMMMSRCASVGYPSPLRGPAAEPHATPATHIILEHTNMPDIGVRACCPRLI